METRAMNYLLVQANAAAVLASDTLRLHAIIAQGRFNEEVWAAVCSLVRTINDNHSVIVDSIAGMDEVDGQQAEDEATYQREIAL